MMRLSEITFGKRYNGNFSVGADPCVRPETGRTHGCAPTVLDLLMAIWSERYGAFYALFLVRNTKFALK